MDKREGARRGFADHRSEREAGRLIYPVLSRRSGGLSLGVNLFPEAKTCSFDCPYCEVFPVQRAEPFSGERLRRELSSFLEEEWPRVWASEKVRDLCISGNGEPSLSPHLDEAVSICAEAKAEHPALLGRSSLVIITNSTGFLVEERRRSLERAQDAGFALWAKLDAGSEELFRLMSGSGYRLSELVAALRGYAVRRPITLQTMLCEVEGRAPGEAELREYADLILSLLEGGAKIEAIQLYTLARPASGAPCRALGDAELADLARLLVGTLAGSLRELPVGVYGSGGQLSAETRHR